MAMEARRGLDPSGARVPSSWELHYADGGKITRQKQHLLSTLSYPSSLMTMCHLCGTAFPGVLQRYACLDHKKCSSPRPDSLITQILETVPDPLNQNLRCKV